MLEVMAEPPRSKGRGLSALLESVNRARAAQARQAEAPGVESSSEPTPTVRIGRGRAALLKKFQDIKIGAETLPVEEKHSPPKVSPPKPKQLVEEPDQPVCKFAGESGRPTNITANYIRLNVDKDKGVFEYDVDFEVPVDSKQMRIRILNSQMDKLGGVKSYDGGRCLYLPIKLPEVQTVLECLHPSDGSTVIMSVIYKKQKKMKDCIHLFNTLFKRIMRTLTMFQFNRNYYDMKSAMFIPQYKLEVLPGYAVSCDEYEGGIMLCLDAQHRVLRTQTVYDLMVELKATAGQRFKEQARQLLLGSSVLTKYTAKNYRIDEIIWDSSPSDTFKSNTGDNVSYLDYYKKHHNITIKDPKQPLLLHKQKLKGSKNLGQEEERLICLVPELCNVTGLTDEMRADYKIMQSVAQHTRLSPAQRMQSLQKFMKRVNDCPEAKKILSDWGLALASATIDLNARVLDNERIIFGNNAEVRTNDRLEWGPDMARNRVCQPVDLNNWSIIHVAKDTTYARNFKECIKRVGPPMGCQINEPMMFSLPNDRTDTVVQQLNRTINPSLQCVVIICPTQRQDLYNAIKKICCVHSPIASQVIMSRTLSKEQRLRAITQKIALQINCKLGGTLWSLSIPAKNWMVIGIDSYHCPENKKFSWYGFVCSTNDNFTKYYSTAVKNQGELGDHIKLCFTKALVKYRELKGEFPKQVVVFRDGIGDGDLEMCKKHEIAQMEDCFKNVGCNTQLCFLVVQKRINTRLFAKVGGSLENPKAGTVMDHTITKLTQFDYYLVSQHVGQGTVTPTHYICLHNSSNLHPDIIQKLTFKLCHLYYNWSGTIRVPAPCLYAHKLAYLIGQCVQTQPDEKLATRLYYL